MRPPAAPANNEPWRARTHARCGQLDGGFNHAEDEDPTSPLPKISGAIWRTDPTTNRTSLTGHPRSPHRSTAATARTG